jgi:hypothetical protein
VSPVAAAPRRARRLASAHRTVSWTARVAAITVLLAVIVVLLIVFQST